jgi:hypothetical protein
VVVVVADMQAQRQEQVDQVVVAQVAMMLVAALPVLQILAAGVVVMDSQAVLEL